MKKITRVIPGIGCFIHFREDKKCAFVSWRELYKINEAPAVDDSMSARFNRHDLAAILEYLEKSYEKGNYDKFTMSVNKNDISLNHYNTHTWPELTICNIDIGKYNNPADDTDYYFMYDEDISEVWYFSQLKDVTKHFAAYGLSRVGMQNMIWKNSNTPQASLNKGFTKKLIFQIYFSKYSMIISDQKQTTLGKETWRGIIKEALRLGHRVFVFQFNKDMPDYTELLDAITNEKELDSYYKYDPQRTFPGNMVFGITKD